MELENKLDKIKKKFTNKSNFLYSTYVWNFNKINPNSKGEDLYTKQNINQNKILNEVFKDSIEFKNVLENKGYKYTKTNDEMKQKLIDLGIIFDIKYYWHKKVSIPKDSDNNESPWFDLYETKKKPNNQDAFKNIMNELNGCITNINENIIKKNEIICSGRRAKCFCFGKFNFKNETTNDTTKLGITIIMLGPGSNERNSGKYLPQDGKYDVLVTMREKKNVW